MNETEIAKMLGLLVILPPDSEFCKLVMEFAQREESDDLGEMFDEASESQEDKDNLKKKIESALSESSEMVEKYGENLSGYTDMVKEILE